MFFFFFFFFFFLTFSFSYSRFLPSVFTAKQLSERWKKGLWPVLAQNACLDKNVLIILFSFCLVTHICFCTLLLKNKPAFCPQILFLFSFLFFTQKLWFCIFLHPCWGMVCAGRRNRSLKSKKESEHVCVRESKTKREQTGWPQCFGKSYCDYRYVNTVWVFVCDYSLCYQAHSLTQSQCSLPCPHVLRGSYLCFVGLGEGLISLPLIFSMIV